MDPPPHPSTAGAPATAPPRTTTPSQPGPADTPSRPSAFPTLEVLPAREPHAFLPPTKRIHTGTDVARFLTSQAYRDIGVFVMQLNRAMCPRVRSSPDPGPGPGPGPRRGVAPAETFTLESAAAAPANLPASVRRLRRLLDEAAALVERAPPDPGPRRFGNVSFRAWHGLLAAAARPLLEQHLPGEVVRFAAAAPAPGGESGGPGTTALDELEAYFLGSFGSAQRLDYGTGHELSFLAFLGCLWKLGAFGDGQEGGPVERNIVLGLIEPYLAVARCLILTYTLEPAGSHGVWGLDDHSFLPYIFGSAQLSRPITESEKMPVEGSVKGAPKPSDVTKGEIVTQERQINMYFSAIGFINDVKKGPFWEHSPMLFDISGIKDGWGKINKGMIKMFNAEVLSKFPVVQHFPFGSIFSWDVDPEAEEPQQSVHMANQPIAQAATTTPGPVGTAAPWAQATSMPGRAGSGTAAPAATGMPYSRAPWTGTASTPAGARQQPPVRGPP